MAIKGIIKKSFLFLMILGLFIYYLDNFSPHVLAEEDASEIKDDINKLEKKADAAQQELNISQNELYRNQIQVRNTQVMISDTEKEIFRKETELSTLYGRLDLNKEILKSYVQELYFFDQEDAIIKLALGEGNLDSVMGNYDDMIIIKDKILNTIDDINQTKKDIEIKKDDLSEKRDKHEELLIVKKAEQGQIYQEIQQQKATLGEIQQKLSDLRNDLNRILGKSYNTGEIKDAIKFANRATSVSKGFLFGMLSIESRLGASTGSCNYRESRMSDYRKDLFKKICDELDYDYKKMKVSCPPASYKGTGGAMGAAQFMSDTWMGYKSKIAAATGHNPPDPWNLVDGVTAMALKLKNDGATGGSVKITSPCNGKKITVSGETYASMKYLGWSCYALTSYAPRIQSLKGGYDDL